MIEAGDVPTVLAALGPKMLQLAAERTRGAHTYLAVVAHTAWARSVLGPGPVLAPAIKAVLAESHDEGMAIAHSSLKPVMQLPAYRNNLLRSGFDERDLFPELTDEVVNALVAVGTADDVASRVQEHLDAGADHVCVELLTGDDTTVPINGWRRLAPALAGFGGA
jgi:probable F420-dependent oxidoreductase